MQFLNTMWHITVAITHYRFEIRQNSVKPQCVVKSTLLDAKLGVGGKLFSSFS